MFTTEHEQHVEWLMTGKMNVTKCLVRHAPETEKCLKIATVTLKLSRCSMSK